MATQAAITPHTLRAMKTRTEKFSCLTAYDTCFARLIDAAGIEVVLVGDSLGMVIQGHPTTIPVTIADMVYHSRAVARGLTNALLMVDMPFMSYATPQQALTNAARLMQEGGAQILKLEGGATQLHIVRALAECSIPVCAHLGLQPQAVHKLGGYRVQGRGDEAAQALCDLATQLQEAGADLLLLECVPASLAARITRALHIPVIGIGAGAECDGQVLVLYDVLGITPQPRPRFTQDFLQTHGSVAEALRGYAQAVKTGTFPQEVHSFS